MPNSNPDSSIRFRSKELALVLDSRKGRSARNIEAKIMLERYILIMEDALRQTTLTKEEAIAVWSALDGCSTAHTEQLPILYQGTLFELKDTCPSAYGQALAWDMAQWIAVVDACDRVGGGSYHVGDLGAELARVGLCE